MLCFLLFFVELNLQGCSTAAQNAPLSKQVQFEALSRRRREVAVVALIFSSPATEDDTVVPSLPLKPSGSSQIDSDVVQFSVQNNVLANFIPALVLCKKHFLFLK